MRKVFALATMLVLAAGLAQARGPHSAIPKAPRGRGTAPGAPHAPGAGDLPGPGGDARNPRGVRPEPLPGLKAAARITRDVFGIAHVRATNEHDLFFLQGYVHAEDRLFQMDVNRRRAGGTTAELFGAAAVPGDVELRTLGLRRAAEASWPALSEETRNAVIAYAEGVNAWVASHPLPPEYGLLELTHFRPWSPLDSVAVSKLIAFSLSFGLEDIRDTQVLSAYAEAAGDPPAFDPVALFFEDLWRSAPFARASTIPDASGASPLSAAPPPAAPRSATSGDAGRSYLPTSARLARRYEGKLRRDPFLATFLERNRPRGSNEWAVAGGHTATGMPLLANDPHLALDVPTTFYPIHLTTGGLDAMGSGFAGVPAVVVGHNRFIAWGATVNPMDVTDVYFEQVVPDPDSPSGLSTLYEGAPESVLAVPERYFANQPGNGVPDDLVPVTDGVPPATLIVPRRNMGPIVQMDPDTGEALSVQFTGFGPTRELDTFLAWDRARNLEEFVHGLRFFDFGSENWAYADIEGNIAYFTSAEMPVREDLQNSTVNGLPPYFIRNGVDGGNEWLPVEHPQPGQALPYEILPFDEMPHIINPPAGWFVNANNDPAGTTLDNDPLNQLRPGGGIFYLSPGYDGFRASRITQMIRDRLQAGGKISFRDMQAMQADVTLLDAQVLVPYILRALEHARDGGADPALAAFAENDEVVEAVERLAHWDFTTPTGIPEGFDSSDARGRRGEPSPEEVRASVAATIYAVWRSRFVANTVDATLEGVGLGGLAPGDQQSMAAVRTLLERFDALHGHGASGLYFFGQGGVGDPETDRDVVILQSMADALDVLAGEPFAAAFDGSTNQDDYRWGRLHRIVFDHPLGGPLSIPPAGGAFPHPLGEALPGIPTDGGFNTPDASRHPVRAAAANDFMFGAGPVNRFVADARPPSVRAQSVWPGGTSGVPGSPFYANLLPLWLTNDTIPLLFRNADLVKHTLSVRRFVPGHSRGRADGGADAALDPDVRGRK